MKNVYSVKNIHMGMLIVEVEVHLLQEVGVVAEMDNAPHTTDH